MGRPCQPKASYRSKMKGQKCTQRCQLTLQFNHQAIVRSFAKPRRVHILTIAEMNDPLFVLYSTIQDATMQLKDFCDKRLNRHTYIFAKAKLQSVK